MRKCELDTILMESTRAVEDTYFNLPIAESAPIYRERVYCYELYHQMRQRWPDGCDYVLNGEVDKKNHPWLNENPGKESIPDFLVHGPGYMERNYAVIEIKNTKAAAADIIRDIDDLREFKNLWNYTYALHLLYGERAEEVGQEALHHLQQTEGDREIELWHHSAQGINAASLNQID